MTTDTPLECAPTELTQRFIADYKAWNDAAFARREETGKIETSGNAYRDMLAKYCRPDKVHQGIAYGSESDHCPAQESVVSASETGNQAVVTTKFQHPQFDFISRDYEYHYSRDSADERWYLDEIYYVDSDGRYPCI